MTGTSVAQVTESSSSDNSLSMGAIAGIAVVLVVVVLVAVGFFLRFFVFRRKPMAQQTELATPTATVSVNPMYKS